MTSLSRQKITLGMEVALRRRGPLPHARFGPWRRRVVRSERRCPGTASGHGPRMSGQEVMMVKRTIGLALAGFAACVMLAGCASDQVIEAKVKSKLAADTEVRSEE